jgi:hypothetical protein
MPAGRRPQFCILLVYKAAVSSSYFRFLFDFQRKTLFVKGQLISKANCQAVNSSKKQMNEFVFTTMRRVFVCFLEEIEDTKKMFRNYLTFSLTFILSTLF